MRSIQAADCVCNQATPHPADPIKCRRARRERRHPKAAHHRSGSEWPPLDSLENKIGTKRTLEVMQSTSGFDPKTVLERRYCCWRGDTFNSINSGIPIALGSV